MFALPLYVLGALPPWPPVWTAAGVQLLAPALLPGLAAAREFATAGRGTPLPYDPPRRLVTGGPYAYVRNPMQLSAVLGYLGCAALFADPRLLLGAVVAAAYSAGLAAWHEDAQLRRAHGERWLVYRTAVRAWLPRLPPWPGRTPATLYIAGSCSMCSGLGGWLAARAPVALRLLPAETHPGRPRRLTYASAAGVRASGVAALARAMEHIHLGWALCGWAIGLPGVAGFAQLAADAFGAGPRRLPGPARPAVDREYP
ncbi:methyltransferase family protein [Streptomonospora salina]|uniref:Protein-S-isoprenylcysteine O-methyltransferase Ste14 n=1 Tax=Streptomonospora salina TaxID=104205 RepID=A0A841E091_9ACTN|nr:isoprenylcysteine carboxylmethyltransferase family protein [Streptomonospora salina]MBB5996466.1 protein-S-isoprenylcysteine O-methyltransferase Ste14 [Streptomonospora salina]